MMQPWLNGSVFEHLIFIRAHVAAMVTSSYMRVCECENVLVVGATNSLALRKPKNAVVNAAHSMRLSASVM